ncbi:MAG: hypothetical protein HRU28_18330 [Rhizobiales bacterium]|nr:hypothetical protein [Hyphomicrobiales bacterium]
MKIKKILLLVLLSFSIGVTSASADDGSVKSAYYLCTMLDKTGLLSKPCDISGWNSEINITLDMSASEARKLCVQVVGLMLNKGKPFNERWKLKISSPYSGENTIAYCQLSK